MLARLVIAGVAWCMAVHAGAAHAADEVAIRVTVTGADAGRGQILASLFDSADSYLRQPSLRKDVAVGDDGSAVIEFGRHPRGTYAVSVIYDRDNDGELDTGFFGIPKEKIGFSNNARGVLGPAKWKDVRFEASGDLHIQIALTKAKD